VRTAFWVRHAQARSRPRLSGHQYVLTTTVPDRRVPLHQPIPR